MLALRSILAGAPPSPMKKQDPDWKAIDAQARLHREAPTIDLVPANTRILGDDYELEEKRSVTSFLPPKLREAISHLPTEVYELDERELTKLIWPKGDPDETSSRLRVAFWAEYDRVQANKESRMDISRVTDGVCTLRYFYSKFILDQRRLAWILQPTVDYTLSIKEMHVLGMTAMRRALALDATAISGKPNVKLIEAQFKIMQHIDMRIKGAIVQRIDQRNLNVNVNSDAPTETADKMSKVAKMTMEELDDQLGALRQASQALTAPSNIVVDLMRDTRPEPVKIERNGKEEGT